jgi:putative flippase GtrA
MTLAYLQRLAATKTRLFADAQRIALLAQFLRFGVVGVAGFGVDTATVYALRGRLGLYGAGMTAYVVAATVTWALNRAWTFRGRGQGPAHRQWALFLATNFGGFILNRGTYVALIATSALCVRYPVLAVAAGAIAGMFANFAASRQLVFR